MQTLEEVQNDTDGTPTGLPNPELYIIVNSKFQTKQNSMAEPQFSYDDVSKNIIESVRETSSIMLQKVSTDDVVVHNQATA